MTVLAGTGGNGGGAMVAARRLHGYGATCRVAVTAGDDAALSPRRRPGGVAADLIRWANRQAAPVLALDVPSGGDATTGTVRDPAVRAAATVTPPLPKHGLRIAAVMTGAVSPPG